MEKLEKLYEGKAKKIYRTDEEDIFWVEYKDDATAFNGEKKGSIAGKGKLNNLISSIFFQLLKDRGIENHFIKRLTETEQLVKKVRIIPLEVVVRNVVAGSLAKRLGMEEGTSLKKPIVELYFKDDDLGDPFINESHVEILGAASPSEVAKMKEMGLRINEVLFPFMKEKGVFLVDFKLEFGLTQAGELILADEISPDTCRFWDAHTQEKMDKDRFRRDLGKVEEAYREILQRLGGAEDV